MNGHQTLTEHIRAQVAETPDQEALILLTEHEGGLRPTTYSYAALDSSARGVAAVLARHVRPGDRVLVTHRSRALFTTGFLACLYAGAVAVPVALSGGGDHHDEQVAAIIRETAAACLLTSTAEAVEVSRLLARTGHGDVVCLPADGPAAADPGGFQPYAPEPDAAAYLQYTSGSTRDPRGVIVTHRSLLANQRAIQRALGTRPGARIGGWLPLHHDMGLVGQLLHPLWLGGTAVMLSPAAFVKRPANWLETVSRYRLAVSAAPDFAYEMCVRRVNDSQLAGLDLACWETAVDGGEPVDAATLAAFAERFAPAGLRPEALTPCYGLAEATLMVSGARGAGSAARAVDAAALEDGRLVEPAGAARMLAPCGPPASADVRIVDPESCQEVPDGRVGEIWVRSESVGPGYWARPAETAAVFGGRIGDAGPEYLRTGDLGAFKDGLLHVTGRLKDMIVVAGRNLYPQDLERTVQQVSGLCGAASAFAVPGARERVVVIQELRTGSRYNVDLADLAASVQQRITEDFDVRATIVLVRPGTVRRTTSGKVERATMRRLFLRGDIAALHQRVEPEVERLLAAGRRR